MTRSKIQWIKFFVFLLIFLLLQISACDGSFRERRQAADSVPSDNGNDNKGVPAKVYEVSKNTLKDTQAQNVVNNASVINSKHTEVNITSKVSSTATLSVTPTKQPVGGMHIPSMDSGALERGIFVVIGLGVLVMAYMVFRSFRLSKTRTQMVRKYGVLAHRQDVEMRPLPLDEDDEDDTTVFDASNIPSHRLHSQDS